MLGVFSFLLDKVCRPDRPTLFLTFTLSQYSACTCRIGQDHRGHGPRTDGCWEIDSHWNRLHRLSHKPSDSKHVSEATEQERGRERAYTEHRLNTRHLCTETERRKHTQHQQRHRYAQPDVCVFTRQQDTTMTSSRTKID